MKKEKIKEIIKQYEENKEYFEQFIISVKNILDNILIVKNFKYHSILSRVKSNNSLKEKLECNEKLKNIKSIFEVGDVCGCRILFYLESDINKFKRHIYNEFNVLDEELKYSPNDYNACHLTVILNDERLNLLEYSAYRGFLIEIQLTTVLDHVWSEMEHDIIYKDKEQLSKFDKESFESIEKTFQDIMENHLKKASHSFDFIYRQVEKLKMGKKVFSTDFFNEIINPNSLNAMYEHLSLLYQYVQEYGDKTPEEFNIIKVIKDTIEKSKNLKQEPIKSIFGYTTGYNYIGVLKTAIEILEIFRYRYPDEVLEILMGLSISKEEEIRKKSLEAITKIAQYNLNALEKINFGAQLFLLKKIEELDDENLNKYFHSIYTIMKEILNPEFEGQSMKDENTLTIKFGPLIVSEQLKNIRKRSIGILKRMFSVMDNLLNKITIIETMDFATQLPTRGEVTDDMLEMVIGDTNYLLDFYLSIIIKVDNEIIRTIDKHLHWIKRRFKEKKLKSLSKIYEIINSDEEYDIYKVFVGFAGDLAIDYENEVAYREKKIQDYVNDISLSNFKKWKERIINIAEKNELLKPGELQFFNKFLSIIGRQKPEIAIELINEQKLTNFLEFIVAGIWQSNLKAKSKDAMIKWIKNDENLRICTRVLFIASEIDIEILNKIFIAAKRKKDIDVLNEIVNVIIVLKSIDAKELFLKSIKELTINDSSEWTRRYFGNPEDILNSLSKEEYEIVLENLLKANNISHSEEKILIPIAKKLPEEIINFYHRRTVISIDRKQGREYHAIPYSLGSLSSLLQNEIALHTILKWFDEKNSIFRFTASRFIEDIFPQFDDILKNKLLKLLDTNYKKNIDVVFYILETYEGREPIFDFCKKIIRKYPLSEKNKREIFRILTRTGTVSGEYGFVKAYQKKKELIKSWKGDKNKRIKDFAVSYEKYLDKNILYETKEADNEIIYRKQEFRKGKDNEDNN